MESFGNKALAKIALYPTLVIGSWALASEYTYPEENGVTAALIMTLGIMMHERDNIRAFMYETSSHEPVNPHESLMDATTDQDSLPHNPPEIEAA